MINKLRQLAANMVISDQFLDLEEEATYFAKVDEFQLNRELGETILSEVLEEFKAVQESKLLAELEKYVAGPMRDGFLNEEEEQRAISFVIRRAPHLSLPWAQQSLRLICQKKQVVTESSFRPELLEFTTTQVTEKQLTDDVRKTIASWALQEKNVPEDEVDRMLEDICLELGLKQSF